MTVTTATVRGQRHLGREAKQTQTWGYVTGARLLAVLCSPVVARPVDPGEGGSRTPGGWPPDLPGEDLKGHLFEVRGSSSSLRQNSALPLNPRGGGKGESWRLRPRTADFLMPTRGLGTGLEDFVSIISAAEAPMGLDFWACSASW